TNVGDRIAVGAPGRIEGAARVLGELAGRTLGNVEQIDLARVRTRSGRAGAHGDSLAVWRPGEGIGPVDAVADGHHLAASAPILVHEPDHRELAVGIADVGKLRAV